MPAVPEEEGVNITVQVAVPTVVPAATVHVPDELRIPAAVPDAEKLTVPVGVLAAPDPVSVTVAVQVESWLTTTIASQLMLVDVGRRRTDMSKKPELGR